MYRNYIIIPRIRKLLTRGLY